MLKRFLNIVLLAALIVITGCQKDVDIFVPDSSVILNRDTVWMDNNLQNSNVVQLMEELVTPAKVDTFLVQNGATFNFEGTEIQIPAFACAPAGTIIAAPGKVQIIFNLLKKKGDLIRFHKPTESDGRLLESGGVFRLLILKDNIPMVLLPGKFITVKYITKNVMPDMKVFNGQTLLNLPAAPFAFTWKQNDSSTVSPFSRQGTSGIDSGYSVFSNKFGWINVDAFRDTAVPQKRFIVSLPKDYTNVNTSVFAVFKNLNSVLEIYPDFANKIWRIDRIPMQRAITLISITKLKNDSYMVAKKDVEANTIASQTVSLIPEKKSLGEIKLMLDGL